MLINLPYDDLFLPRIGSVTFAGRPCSTPGGGGGGAVRGAASLRGGFAQKGNGPLGGD